MLKTNRKETYAACLILLVGIIYLAAQAGSLFSIGSTTVNGDTIQLSKNEMLSHTRSILTIILSFAGGILFLRIKTTGWVISQSLFLLLLAIVSGILISNQNALASFALMVIVAGIILLLTAIIFLLQKETRLKFIITRKHLVYALILFAFLATFYFLIQ